MQLLSETSVISMPGSPTRFGADWGPIPLAWRHRPRHPRFCERPGPAVLAQPPAGALSDSELLMATGAHQCMLPPASQAAGRLKPQSRPIRWNRLSSLRRHARGRLG